MSTLVTTEAVAAPIWGRGDDALINEPIGTVVVMSTAAVASGVGVEDPSLAPTSKVVVLTAVVMSGVRALAMCATSPGESCGP
jgi:hypothetical protein